MLANYLLRAADPMSEVRGVRAFKCVVDPCAVTEAGVHSFATDPEGLTANDQGVTVPLKRRTERGFYSAGHLQLNHYYSRSDAELQAKVGRGPNVASKAPEYRRKVLRTVENIEAAQVEDRAALEYLARIGQV